MKNSALRTPHSVLGSWLPDMDLNHDKQIQSLLCYRYTIGQAGTFKRLMGFANQSSRQTCSSVNAWNGLSARSHSGPLLHPSRLRYGAVHVPGRVEAERRRKERGNRPRLRGFANVSVDRMPFVANVRQTVNSNRTAEFPNAAASFPLSPGARTGVRADVTPEFPPLRVTHHVSRN